MWQAKSPRPIRHVSGRITRLTPGANLCALAYEVKDYFVVSDVSRAVKRRMAATVHRIHIIIEFDAILDRLDWRNRGVDAPVGRPTYARGGHQRGSPRLGCDIGVGAVLDQKTHCGDITRLRGPPERRRPRGVNPCRVAKQRAKPRLLSESRVHSRPALKKRFHQIEVAYFLLLR